MFVALAVVIGFGKAGRAAAKLWEREEVKMPCFSANQIGKGNRGKGRGIVAAHQRSRQSFEADDYVTHISQIGRI